MNGGNSLSERYQHESIEKKWQERWESDALFRTSSDNKKKWYALTMFPYPSGDLHTGHWYAMAPSDVSARLKRMQGHNVLFPIGFDSFGLPAENAAIKQNVDPRTWTYNNIERMHGQLRAMGASFNWEREIITSDPDYYQWTQWWFLQLYNQDLAYQAEAAANWCPGCQTVLANEQVLNGNCERCDNVVSKRFLKQWFFRITKYAEELLDFSKMDWPKRIETMQTNWIGRSEGARISFDIDIQNVSEKIEVFTTRPDTIYGATYMVLAPEHPLVKTITQKAYIEDVQDYIEATTRISEIDRLSTERKKTGVFTGAYAINPVSKKHVPIWIADYVLSTYGTGAIMAVPAHDERDFEFAQAYKLEVIPVFDHEKIDVSEPLEAAFTTGRQMVNSEHFNGTLATEAIKKVTTYLEEQQLGEESITYRLRDWLISRQRYWGTPIPIIHCETCGIVPVPESDLPVLLPENVEFTTDGKSPLEQLQEWWLVECPNCKKPARRETDTIDTFVCSSWYQMRYIDPRNKTAPFAQEFAKEWLPVDQYTGGSEHAVMHLLYTRFFWKTARDLGLVDADEPMLRLFNQGIILGTDGNRMSKSRGNVVAPDQQVEKYGADAFRCQLMFIGPWDQGGPYDPKGMPGIVRWLNRVWNVANHSYTNKSESTDPTEQKNLERTVHQTIAGVTEDLERFQFNTAISKLMSLTSTLGKVQENPSIDNSTWHWAIQTLLLLMAPLAPHITEELWELLGQPYSIHKQPWPDYDPQIAAEEILQIVIQINGKVRDKIEVAATINKDDVEKRALQQDRIKELLLDQTPKKIIYVPGKLINIVV